VHLKDNIRYTFFEKLTNRKITTVDVTTLSVPQLRTLQSRLNSELEQLTNSHAKLRAAQSKFRDCVRTINDGVVGKKTPQPQSADTNSILVPLTSSLYVKGKLADREKVIVDVGTGFYVEKVRYSPNGDCVLSGFADQAPSFPDYRQSYRVL
jgi:prefoldin alpha subunit